MDVASLTLDKVLGRIDADLDASVERLFAWLRIPSISTDPAYAEDYKVTMPKLAAASRTTPARW